MQPAAVPAVPPAAVSAAPPAAVPAVHLVAAADMAAPVEAADLAPCCWPSADVVSEERLKPGDCATARLANAVWDQNQTASVDEAAQMAVAVQTQGAFLAVLPQMGY